MDIVFHILIELPVHIDAELHKVGISCRSFRCIPLSFRVADRLVETAFNPPDGSPSRIFFLPQCAATVLCPRFFQMLPCVVLHQQEVVKALLYFCPVGFHLFPCIVAHIPLDSSVLVVDLDCHYRRIIDKRQSRIGIHMAEQLLCILFLEFNHPLVVQTVPFDTGGCAARILHAVSLFKLSRYNQVYMEIDALLFQLRRKVIEPVQPIRVEFPAGTGCIVQKRCFLAAAPASRLLSHRGVRRMETDDVHSHAGEPFRHSVRRLMIRRIGTRRHIES